MPVRAYTPIWLAQSDLEAATSVEAVRACCDDANVGSPDPRNVAMVIRRAEQAVLSWLSEYGPPPYSPEVLMQLGADDFLQSVALDYAVAFMFDRHPEYARSVRNDDSAGRFKACEAQMERILDSRQRPTTVQVAPANVGGVVVDGGVRAYVDSPGGRPGGNAGDY